MAVAQLGDLKWRIDPQRINWNYQIDANRIETLGGQVVQILGATLSDLTIMGLFGQDRPNNLESWQLAVAFHKKIQQMMDAQTLPAKTIGLPSSGNTSSDAAIVHQPVTFSYLDGTHNWSFRVLIKAIQDQDGVNTLTHTVGKASYGYILTLFIVESGTDVIKQVLTDQFISRISQGLGWTRSNFQGKTTAQQVVNFLNDNGGTVDSYISKSLLGGAS